MKIDGWEYYNHAAVPTTAPHTDPDMRPIEDENIWKIDGGTPFLARWTSDFDCDHTTQWWYIIKNTPFNSSDLKAKRRYEINKGIKNFDIKVITPNKYCDELYDVQVAAFSAYPEKYRPSVKKEEFISLIDQWNHYVCFGAFQRETNELCGYALLSQKSNKYTAFNVLNAKPEFEKSGVNAALVEGVLRFYELFLTNGGYICDGARSINHETAFQDYLEKYFGFRKAYCKLHIKYNPKIRWIIKLIYPVRKFLLRMDGIGFIHSVNSVLRMEEIYREDSK